MDRPETIELVGQTLRWSEEQHLYESTVPKARPRLVAWPYLGEDGWVCTARLGSEVRIDLGAPTLPALDLALRAALAEVADAVAAWLPEREARVRAEERERIATERSGQLMPTVDAIRAEERERCAVVIQEARYRLANNNDADFPADAHDAMGSTVYCDGSCRKARRAA